MPNDDTIFLKKSVGLMGFFDVEELRKVTPDIEHQTYNKGEKVLFKGEVTEGFYIIKKGSVLVTARKGAKGGEVNVSLKAGAFFGSISIVEEIPASASVTASEAGTEILTIPHASFKKLLEMKPAMKKALEDIVATHPINPPKTAS